MSQRVPTTSVSYRTTRPRTNGHLAARCPCTVPEIEALVLVDDPAVGVAEGDRDGVAAAHHDAFDERLAAIVEAGHPRSLPGQRRSAPRRDVPRAPAAVPTHTPAMRLELTKRGDYAVRAMLALARGSGNGLLSARRISDAMGIPVRFLPQVLADLQRGGLVEAGPGPLRRLPACARRVRDQPAGRDRGGRGRHPPAIVRAPRRSVRRGRVLRRPRRVLRGPGGAARPLRAVDARGCRRRRHRRSPAGRPRGLTPTICRPASATDPSSAARPQRDRGQRHRRDDRRRDQHPARGRRRRDLHRPADASSATPALSATTRGAATRPRIPRWRRVLHRAAGADRRQQVGPRGDRAPATTQPMRERRPDERRRPCVRREADRERHDAPRRERDADDEPGDAREQADRGDEVPAGIGRPSPRARTTPRAPRARAPPAPMSVSAAPPPATGPHTGGEADDDDRRAHRERQHGEDRAPARARSASRAPSAGSGAASPR